MPNSETSPDAKFKILIVEDDNAQRLFLTGLVKSLGYTTESVDTAAKAHSILDQFSPDLLLLDVYLPDSTGIVILQELRENPKYKELPIILMSADQSEELFLVGMSNGANDFLFKPIKFAELTTRVQKELELQFQKRKVAELTARLERDKGLLLKYFSHDIVEKILNDEITHDIGGSQMKASILFLDIRDSTTLAEKIDPSTFARFISSTFTDIMDLILGNGGSVNKMLGDGLLATYGCPVTSPNDALNSVVSAMKIRQWIHEYNQIDFTNKVSSIRYGIGICTGIVFAGNIGSHRRMEYTVMGDSVNTASRLQSLSKEVDTDILIDGETYNLVKDHFVLEKIEIDHVKGKKDRLDIYKVISCDFPLY